MSDLILSSDVISIGWGNYRAAVVTENNLECSVAVFFFPGKLSKTTKMSGYIVML